MQEWLSSGMAALLLTQRSTELKVLRFTCILMASAFIAQATTTTKAEFHFSFGLLLTVLCLLYWVMLYSIAISIEMALAEAMIIIRHESGNATAKIAASAASVNNAIAKLLLSTLA